MVCRRWSSGVVCLRPGLLLSQSGVRSEPAPPARDITRSRPHARVVGQILHFLSDELTVNYISLISIIRYCTFYTSRNPTCNTVEGDELITTNGFSFKFETFTIFVSTAISAKNLSLTPTTLNNVKLKWAEVTKPTIGTRELFRTLHSSMPLSVPSHSSQSKHYEHFMITYLHGSPLRSSSAPYSHQTKRGHRSAFTQHTKSPLSGIKATSPVDTTPLSPSLSLSLPPSVCVCVSLSLWPLWYLSDQWKGSEFSRMSLEQHEGFWLSEQSMRKTLLITTLPAAAAAAAPPPPPPPPSQHHHHYHHQHPNSTVKSLPVFSKSIYLFMQWAVFIQRRDAGVCNLLIQCTISSDALLFCHYIINTVSLAFNPHPDQSWHNVMLPFLSLIYFWLWGVVITI